MERLGEETNGFLSQEKKFLTFFEHVGVRDSRCSVIAGVPPPSLLPKGGGTKQITFSVYHIECPAKERLPHA